MIYLLFTVALSLSAVAAWYAIAGLTAIFAAAVIPIMIMGSLLEASKLVVASWLYRNWKEIPTLLKSYFSVALVILMLLTSMGIFGFLSKAHLDQAIPSGDVQSKLALLDEKIKTEKDNINASRKELTQLDSQVDQTLSRTTEASGADRAIAIRRGQQKDRTRILNEIGNAQSKIAKYQEERQPIASEVRKVEAEVGPIKYIAALIYGDNLDENLLEKAVRIVTIMIVLVFDPLAVLLLVAANWQLRKERGQIEPIEEKPPIDWTGFFKKKPVEEFPEKEPETKQVVIKDDITVEEHPVVAQEVAEVIPEAVEVVEEPSDEEIPEIEVDEPTKDWEPELYQRKQLGRFDAEVGNKPSKTQSFLNKVQDVFSPGVTVKTIETEVEELQESKKDNIIPK
jgi:hypothetical protein